MRFSHALRCAIVATAFAVAGGSVQAAPIHPIAYDPPTGSGTLDSNGCNLDSDGCTIDLLTTIITDSFGNTWRLPGPLFDIATGVGFDEGGNLDAIQTPFFTVELTEGTGCGDGCGSSDFVAFAITSQQLIGCETASFRLNLDNTTDLVNECNVENHGIYIIGAPLAEPASLGLIFGGVAAAWVARRRKRAH